MIHDNETVYDEQIAPLVTQIIEICRQYNIPIFATFQYAPESFCTTGIQGDGGHGIIQHLLVMVQNCAEPRGINVDKYITWLLQDAYKNNANHSSVYLQMLGVPVNPKLLEEEEKLNTV